MKNYISLLFLIMICVETAHSQDKLFEKSYFFDLDTAFNQKITGIKKILQQGEFIYVVAEIGHQDVNGVTDEVFFFLTISKFDNVGNRIWVRDFKSDYKILFNNLVIF